eukprot:6304319-Pyramimonas_sp.AAC.1
MPPGTDNWRLLDGPGRLLNSPALLDSFFGCVYQTASRAGVVTVGVDALPASLARVWRCHHQ